MPSPKRKIDEDMMNLTNDDFWGLYILNNYVNTGAAIVTLVSGFGLLNSTTNEMWLASLALGVIGSSILSLTIGLEDDIQAVRHARYGRVKRDGKAE